ncbi:hypothetical protein BH23ACT2_BH23ACT2_11660 [soil metagenome]
MRSTVPEVPVVDASYHAPIIASGDVSRARAIGASGGVESAPWMRVAAGAAIAHAYMVSVTVRDVPEGARDELASRAA